MKILNNPVQAQWPELIRRPALNQEKLEASVADIVEDIRIGGDQALVNYTQRFDGVHLDDLRLPEGDLEAAGAMVPEPLRDAILQARANIEAFHRAQQHSELRLETMPGVLCMRRAVPIERVGLYVPGGSAPLFSTVLMLGIPAMLAGCKKVILCTPPNAQGRVHPAILYTAHLLGINEVYRVGGAQAIAAMAYGTETIPAVDKIFGPGNQYVTLAKQLVTRTGTAIDMPAGPSELGVLADETANPAFVAADLLSQAEHGPDSQVLLVATSERIIADVNAELDRQLLKLPRAAIARQALANSRAIYLPTPEAALELMNAYAPEHLSVASAHPETYVPGIVNAGSVFLGHFAPESVGDYASGTNHTLPTAGFARAYSGVSVDSFVKQITFQQLTEEGILSLGPVVEIMAAAEGLDAHRLAVTQRLEYLRKPVTVDA